MHGSDLKHKQRRNRTILFICGVLLSLDGLLPPRAAAIASIDLIYCTAPQAKQQATILFNLSQT